ncbi:FIST C-terminal domain-containing protein [Christensenellaceae bacterium OttesenSCG-928-M15]|nr:FIST C-terminal domain-containing protein [Christensenellaceae bacterium OttesenSCG-928-M15]
MIKAYSITTTEIDDVEAALQDILAQTKRLPLKKNNVGIVVCHHDFVNGGIVRAASGALPFPLVGITTFYQAAPSVMGLFELTITVLSSDDVCFSVAFGEDATGDGDPKNIVFETYERARRVYEKQPSLIMSFLSMNRPTSGDEYLRYIDEISGGVNNFGAVATGDDEAGENLFVLCGETASFTGFAVLLFIGAVEANFYYGNYKPDKMLELTATVTRAEGTKLYELNGQPAVAYLRKSGLSLMDSERDKINTIPLLFKMPGDDALIARNFAGFDDDGALLGLAEIPEQATLKIGTFSIEDILDVSDDTIKQALRENPQAEAIFMFSCLGRYIILGLDPTLEMEHVVSAVKNDAPYLMSYVGGEICPVVSAGKMRNCYHNASFIVCTLG